MKDFLPLDLLVQVVNVVFDQSKTSFEDMLDIFWDAHDPTTKNRQGNDVGSQYSTLSIDNWLQHRQNCIHTHAR